LHILILVTDIVFSFFRGRQLGGIIDIILLFAVLLVEPLAERIILVLVFSNGSISADSSSFVSGSEGHNVAFT
jgi:hypothetical protein